ncbi:MAG: CHASE domain-containing protein [Bacteroidetes bacterium]|nr:CHASE domain-containing protein [Bacteroidota bacterium]
MNGFAFAGTRKPIWNGIAAFIIAAALTFGIASQSYVISKERERMIVLREINSVKDRLKTALNYDLAAAKTLAYIIENYGVPKDFDKVAKGILSSNKNIDGLQLTTKGVTTHVYPLKGNESIIGFDILSNPLRSKEAYKALKKKQFFFAGPYELKQGGIAIVGRLPIFKDSTFFGFSVVLVKLPTLLKASGIDTLESNHFIYQLSKINPNTQKEEFFLPNKIQLDKEQFVSVEIPDGEWKLYVMSKNKNKFFDTIVFSVLGFGVSFIFALFVWYLAKQPEKLNKLVEEKTSQLISVQKATSTTLNRINDGMISLDNDWRYTFLNDAALANHPKGRAGTLGKIIWDIHPQMIGSIFWYKYHEAMQTKKVVELEGKYDYRDVWLLVKIYPSQDGLTIIYTDISRRKAAEEKNVKTTEQLRQLTSHLQNIREEERTRIAREIHDELGQQLTALKMDASWISKKLITDDKPITEKLSSMIGLIDSTVKTVRRISSDLRPGILDDLGLIPALEWQGAEYEKRTGINWRFHSNLNDIPLDRNVSTNVFRIFQEAFTNIMRHAGATEIETSVEKRNENLILTIKDNGQGFDVDKSRKKNSWGIIGMKERATLMNGELIIESEKLKGTIVTLKVPLITNQL